MATDHIIGQMVFERHIVWNTRQIRPLLLFFFVYRFFPSIFQILFCFVPLVFSIQFRCVVFRLYTNYISVYTVCYWYVWSMHSYNFDVVVPFGVYHYHAISSLSIVLFEMDRCSQFRLLLYLFIIFSNRWRWNMASEWSIGFKYPIGLSVKRLFYLISSYQTHFFVHDNINSSLVTQHKQCAATERKCGSSLIDAWSYIHHHKKI